MKQIDKKMEEDASYEAMFLITSPFQYLVARSAIFDFSLDIQKCILVHLPSSDSVSKYQINKFIKNDNWGQVFTFDQYPLNKLLGFFKPSSYLRLRAQISFSDAVDLELQKYNGRIQYLFFGDYRAVVMRHILNKINAEELVMLDDGSITPQVAAYRNKNVSRTYYDSANFRHRSHLKAKHQAKSPLCLQEPNKLVFYSLYGLLTKPEDKLIPVQNLFTAFDLDKKNKKDEVWLIGSNHYENNICELSDYTNLIERIVHFYRGQKLVYIPHRRESKDKLKILEKSIGLEVRHLNMPIELYLYKEDGYPKCISATASTVVDTVSRIFGDRIEINCFELTNDYLRKKRSKHIKRIQLQHAENRAHNVRIYSTEALSHGGYIDQDRFGGVTKYYNSYLQFTISDDAQINRAMNSKVSDIDGVSIQLLINAVHPNKFKSRDILALYDQKKRYLTSVEIQGVNSEQLLCSNYDDNGKTLKLNQKVYVALVEKKQPASHLDLIHDVNWTVSLKGLQTNNYSNQVFSPFGDKQTELLLIEPGDESEHTLELFLSDESQFLPQSRTLSFNLRSAGLSYVTISLFGHNRARVLEAKVDIRNKVVYLLSALGEYKSLGYPINIQGTLENWVNISLYIPDSGFTGYSISLDSHGIEKGKENTGVYYTKPELFYGSGNPLLYSPPVIQESDAEASEACLPKLPKGSFCAVFYLFQRTPVQNAIKLDIGGKSYVVFFNITDYFESHYALKEKYDMQVYLNAEIDLGKSFQLILQWESETQLKVQTNSKAIILETEQYTPLAAVTVTELSDPAGLGVLASTTYSAELGKIETHKILSSSLKVWRSEHG